MEYPAIKFVFDRKKVATKVRKGLVQIEVKSEHKRKWIGTGVKVYAGEWSNTRLVVSRFDAAMLNNSLTTQLENIQGWVNELRRKKEIFDFEKLSVFLNQAGTPRENFIDFLEHRINGRRDIADTTRRSHRKLIHSLKEFKKIKFFSDLTKQNIIAYDEWLHKKDYVQTTVYSYHKFLKTYIHDAMRRDLLQDDPYISLKIEQGKSKTRKYLTEIELSSIMGCILPNNSLNKVRDLFIFQSYTGLSYADLAKFDFTKSVERNGKYVLHGIRQKSGEDFYIVLLSPALKILKKYNYILPIIANQQYNNKLKLVAAYAGIDRNLTSHMARHTFAVYCLNHGVSVETLAKMMGHTDISTTQLYAKIVNSTVERAFDRLEEQINKNVSRLP